MSDAAVTAAPAIKEKISRDDWIMRGCMVVIGIFLLFFIVLPLYTLMSKSFENRSGDFVGLANYFEYFSTPALFLSAVNSLYISVIGTFVVLGTAFVYGFRERETILDLFEEITGDRLMYAYFRPGGVAWEVPDNFATRMAEVLKSVTQGIKDLDGLLTENEIFQARTRNIGVISAADAIDWGMSGPSLRASGVPLDIRRDEPYLKYDELEFDVVTTTNGDVFDRYYCRIEEMRQSVHIIEQCMEKLPEGPILPDRMPRMLRTPPGEVYIRTEAPRGEFGIYLVSKGGNRPYRLKIRSACLSNLQPLRDMTIGHYIADAVVILGSIDIVLCEVDR